MATALRGFAFSTREALAALKHRFGSSEFYFRQALEECNINPKAFAKLRADGIVVKLDMHWPSRWRIASQYVTPTSESKHPQLHKR